VVFQNVLAKYHEAGSDGDYDIFLKFVVYIVHAGMLSEQKKKNW